MSRRRAETVVEGDVAVPVPGEGTPVGGRPTRTGAVAVDALVPASSRVRERVDAMTAVDRRLLRASPTSRDATTTDDVANNDNRNNDDNVVVVNR